MYYQKLNCLAKIICRCSEVLCVLKTNTSGEDIQKLLLLSYKLSHPLPKRTTEAKLFYKLIFLFFHEDKLF